MTTNKVTQNIMIAVIVFIILTGILFVIKFTVLKDKYTDTPSAAPLFFNRQTYPKLPLGQFKNQKYLNFNRTVGGLDPNTAQRHIGTLNTVPTYN